MSALFTSYAGPWSIASKYAAKFMLQEVLIRKIVNGTAQEALAKARVANKQSNTMATILPD